MNDPRADAVIAAVSARYPDARVSVVPPTDPDEIQIPDLLVVIDAEGTEDSVFDRRREIERFALAAIPITTVPASTRSHAWRSI